MDAALIAASPAVEMADALRASGQCMNCRR
jgi:hypothetical protein